MALTVKKAKELPWFSALGMNQGIVLLNICPSGFANNLRVKLTERPNCPAFSALAEVRDSIS
jgi:hypothetical protein